MWKATPSLTMRRLWALAAVLVAAVGLAAGPSPASASSPTRSGSPLVELAGSVYPTTDPRPGERLTFTVVLSNPTAAPAYGWHLMVPIPTGYADVTWTCRPDDSGSACGTASGDGAMDQTANIGAGGSITVVFAGQVDPVTPVAFTFAAILHPPMGGCCACQVPPGPPGAGIGESVSEPCGWTHRVTPVTAPVTPTPKPTASPSPEPTPAPSPQPTPPSGTTPPVGPSRWGEPSAPGERLPVTGLATTVLAVAGVASILIGTALLWYAGRRWGGRYPSRPRR